MLLLFFVFKFILLSFQHPFCRTVEKWKPNKVLRLYWQCSRINCHCRLSIGFNKIQFGKFTMWCRNLFWMCRTKIVARMPTKYCTPSKWSGQFKIMLCENVKANLDRRKKRNWNKNIFASYKLSFLFCEHFIDKTVPDW